jgi:ATP synthase protein I
VTAERGEERPPSQNPGDRGKTAQTLAESVRRHRQRRERWRREQRQGLAQNLVLVGSLGWSLVTPMLAGAFIGHFIDHRYHTGVFWSATLIFLGTVAGAYIVWDRLRRQ